MSGYTTIREFLKFHTKDDHELLDKHFVHLNLENLSLSGDFVYAHAYTFQLIEEYLNLNASGILPSELSQHTQHQHIFSVLKRVNRSSERTIVMDFRLAINPSYSYLLGVIYVLKGSQLGGKFLKHSFLKSTNPLVNLLGQSFEVKSLSWNDFLNYLNVADIDRSECLKGARDAFKIFILVFNEILVLGNAEKN